MHKTAIGLCALLVLGVASQPIAAGEAQVARAETICDYTFVFADCQTSTNRPVAADQTTPAPQVAPVNQDEKRVVDIALSGEPGTPANRTK